MLSILIALASRCPLTILDEPASGLDVDMDPMNLQKVFVSLCGHDDVE